MNGLTHTYAIESVPDVLLSTFYERVGDHEYKFISTNGYPTDAKTVKTEGAEFISTDKNGNISMLFHDEIAVGVLVTNYGSSHFSTAGKTREAAKAMMDKLMKLAPPYEEPRDDRIRVSFWSHSGMGGGSSVTRSLDVPTWDQISPNYNSSTADLLSKFINPKFRPGRGGQLLLWNGEPGTGKTTALRALGREWKEWCDIHYITDPDKFFGTHADYMLQVLLSAGSEYDDSDFTQEMLPPKIRKDKNRWRLLVLEDCGELLGADAKTTLGQGLARFLNAVDGLIGQGLRFMVLVTTNEEIGKLHEAVIRPGRCLAQVEFKPLDQDEIVTWLKAHKVDPKTSQKPNTIAGLYAEAENFGMKSKKHAVGFGF